MASRLKQKLEALLSCSRDATPGPWVTKRVLSFISVKSLTQDVEVAICDEIGSGGQAPIDAEFLVKARQGLPKTTKALLRVVGECEGQLGEKHPEIAQRLLEVIETELDP